MKEVHDFMEQLLYEKGIADLDEEVKERTIADMTDILMRQIDHAAISSLTDEQADELAAKLDSGELSEDDVPEYLEKLGLNLQQISLTTMIQFRELYLGEVDASEAYAASQNTNAEQNQNTEEKPENNEQ